MERAEIAKVAVAAAPYSIDRPYDYLIPDSLLEKALPGVRVQIPFGRGNRSSEGMILARTEGEKAPGLKAISALLDTSPVLDRAGIDLALFLRQRYFCTMYEAVRTILPAGLWYQYRESYRLKEELTRPEADELAGKIRGSAGVLDFLFGGSSRAELSELKEACGEAISDTLKALCKTGVLISETEALRRIGDKTKRNVELAVDAESALLEADRRKGAPLRSEVLRLLAKTGKTSASDLCYFTGASMRTLRSLEKAGFVTFSEEEDLRVPAANDVTPGEPILLNEEQQTAFAHILALIEAGKPAVSLLEGVTGSGKTEIYIRLVQEALHRGRTAMVLVPEIVLTPQMMRRFSSYFGTQVVMLHSALKLSERYDQWKRIRRGDVSVVLGTRSAVFAPLENLGLIVLDEEQESSYQSENPPRYHTRDVAKFRCTQSGCTLLLGSATPSVETTYAARQGTYQLDVLRRRYNEKALPRVEIADLRQEIRNGNSGAISGILRQELSENLSRGEQSILFLNRRGNSRMLLCGECGKVPECPRCSVPLTYHSANERLMCHYCGHSERVIDRCPSCGGLLKHIGVGTQKVEEELHQLFPDVGVLRMDADTAAGGHEKLLKKFETEKIPILLGTQMVAKGLDFENVTLVGVLSADLSLYIDNYLAPERTFSLLTQVVGRAGRGEKQGRAVIQTYTPGNEVILSAASQDDNRFYEQEISLRKLRRYPPFADLFTFTVSGGDEGTVLRAAASLREELRKLFADPQFLKDEPEILGPAPAPIVKVNNRFRYRCLLVGKNSKATRERVAWVLREFSSRRENRGLHIFVDCNTME
ncbi:MAG: primosomal protein N' [Oscillibacter sp.]|jgi:primosomal protein N' (replication factor Y)|nr:primosomal protein N' [Oscillibacter sp.]